MPGFRVFMTRLEQRFARYAAHAQTRSAERFLFFHAAHAHAQLRGANRGHIAARSTANDDEIQRFRHDHASNKSRSGASTHSLMRTKNCTASRPSIAR